MLGKKYDFRNAEKRHLKSWMDEGIYRFDPESIREIYSIDTPPPTVSGSLHIGHIFSYTQAEMIARFHRMQGRNVYYPMGFDDNGLPTERLVEKEIGIPASQLPREEFIRRCMEVVEKYEAEYKNLWQSLGFSVDWDLSYQTISPVARRISQRSFLDLVRSGRAYLEETPVLWCTTCGTSIAQAELESRELETRFITIPFVVEGREIPVATTRPELLYGCVALFVHPEDSRYADITGKMARVPLYGFEVPVMADPRASMEKGTGAVMCCTFGDTTDLEWFQEHKLPYKQVIMQDGMISGNVPHIGGLKVEEARSRIIGLLEENGLIRKSEGIIHSVSVHERCGKTIEIIPSRQWFIRIMDQKERLLEAADKIQWYPPSMKTRYQLWVENLKWDWCISRQRYFGVPFPLWYCKACGSAIFARDEDLPVNPLETAPPHPCGCGCQEYVPESAVMDTWATSALTPLINAKWGEKQEDGRLIPMTMRTQAHEIIRTWAFYTIAKSLFHTGRIPWRDIMVCGFVTVDGQKISKSKNNAGYSPAELIARYSADGLRYWATSCRLGTDTQFSENELKASQRFLTKLWNAARFCSIHLKDYVPSEPASLYPLDAWILERCRETTMKARALLTRYEVGAARSEVDILFWKDFCDNYLELVKDRLYKPEVHGEEARSSARYALYCSLSTILKLYAIYVPFITEEIWQHICRKHEKEHSIHQTLWMDDGRLSRDLLEFGEAVKAVLGETRRYKSEHKLSQKAGFEHLAIRMEKRFIPWFRRSMKDFMACSGARDITLQEGPASVEIRE